MDWMNLLSHERLERPDAAPQEGRSLFQQDLDRIVFSAAFRRLAHKTQVHPLSPNDHVHTRLTHSIEVASVGRSIGTMIGREIAGKLNVTDITADTFGYIVQAACLAHDIGNPPFGHSGEDAIQSWFKQKPDILATFGSAISGAKREDFLNFEGNAQGFRILTQLENHKWNGGLQLTFAVLGTFTKYPKSSIASPKNEKDHAGTKKFGFFDSERTYFSQVADQLGLIRPEAGENCWCRHPLAYVLEAADDICYAIIDIEDGYALKYIGYKEAYNLLHAIAGSKADLSNVTEDADRIAKLRAVAIGELVKETAKVFLDHESELLNGNFEGDLISKTSFDAHIRDAKELATKEVYWSDNKTKLEAAGYEIIFGLLDIFHEVASALKRVDYNLARLSGKPQRLARLMRGSLDGAKVNNEYEALLRVTDFISGMTDRYALNTYRSLKGISL